MAVSARPAPRRRLAVDVALRAAGGLAARLEAAA